MHSIVAREALAAVLVRVKGICKICVIEQDVQVHAQLNSLYRTCQTGRQL